MYNRIDGPGSSLDLPLFQQAFWSLPEVPEDLLSDPTWAWSANLPRTVGMAINIGMEITAHPLPKGNVGVQSVDFGFHYVEEKGNILPNKKFWLLHLLELFGLSGVEFRCRNLCPELKSAGLGGSAAVTTGVALLANKLAGSPFSDAQLVGMASRVEHDLGVSITGTQEQSNAVYGGVRDYVWFPHGVPGQEGAYGSSLHQEIILPEQYSELRKRVEVYFTTSRNSVDVNAIWCDQMSTLKGFLLHKEKCALAHNFREALRMQDWEGVSAPITRYREIRTELCPAYMTQEFDDLQKLAEQHGATIFPMGAGGGGSALVYAPDPSALAILRQKIEGDKRFYRVSFEFIPYGHQFFDVDGFGE